MQPRSREAAPLAPRTRVAPDARKPDARKVRARARVFRVKVRVRVNPNPKPNSDQVDERKLSPFDVWLQQKERSGERAVGATQPT